MSYEIIKVDTFKEVIEKAKEGYQLILQNSIGYIMQKEISSKKENIKNKKE